MWKLVIIGSSAARVETCATARERDKLIDKAIKDGAETIYVSWKGEEVDE